MVSITARGVVLSQSSIALIEKVVEFDSFLGVNRHLY